MVSHKNTGIVWIRQPFARGRWLARRDTLEMYEQHLEAKASRNLNPVIPSPRGRRGG